MHGLASANHIATERLTDALVSKTDPENRQLTGKVADQFQRYAGLIRCTGARRYDDALGLQGFDLGHAKFVVAYNLHLGT